MMAENSLSYQTTRDIDEMVRASEKIPDDCCLLVYVDGSGDAAEESQPRLLRIYNRRAETVCIFPEQDSCSGEVLSNVLQMIRRDFMSESYSIVMWSHGSGWIPQPLCSVGIDNNNNSYSDKGTEMDIPVMREALERSGIHFDWILFDACFMQCVEVAYEMKDVTDYVIGSPAEIPVSGAPYDRILPSFFSVDSRRAAFGIAQGYFDFYKDSKGLVISVVDTSLLDDLAMATSMIIRDVNEVSMDERVQQYGPWSAKSYWRPEYYDMASLLYHSVDSSAYDYWFRLMTQAIPLRLYTDEWTTIYDFEATVKDSGHIAAVSMFLPAERYEPYGHNETIKNYKWWQRKFSC